ncbi:MBL fold metallo-hydrolase [Psychrobacillus sp. FSL H8-0484]|uniref:MBL fold metallo-hydrolase n=1 Tax=Psychrobacillus sp. FSL H8-0484 TaxID=2921390 RepID=UPI0030FD1F2B
MIQYDKENMRVFQSSLYKTTSAVIELDEAIVMTDPNWLPHEVDEIKAYVNQIRKDRALYIIYTHSDFDHIIGSGAFPDAKVIASQAFNENKQKDEAINKVHSFDQRYYLQRNYKPEYPLVDYVVSKDGQKLILGKSTLTFYLAPGHTNDGLFTIIEPAGIFLSGDYLSDVEFPFIFDSYLEYLKTMNKAKDIFSLHSISVHVPGHGHTTEDKTEMEDRLKFAQAYLDQLIDMKENMEEILKGRYIFFDGMKDIHVENQKLAFNEIKQIH